MKSATKIKKLKGFSGEAYLYELSEPVTYWEGSYEERGETTNFVVVSAATGLSGPETFIFPADEEGNVVDWTELGGSFRGGLNHDQALRIAGYEPQESPNE